MDVVNEKINFYAVEENRDGSKYLHMRGYFYNSNDGSKKPYRLVLFESSMIELKDFLNSNREDVFTNLLDDSKQSYYEMGKTEAKEQFQIWERESSLLHLADINIDTPAGEYRMEEHDEGN